MNKILTVKQWLEEKNKKPLFLVGLFQKFETSYHRGRVYPENLFLEQVKKLY